MRLDEISTLNDYLVTYGRELTDDILSEAKPLFNPGDPWDEKINNLLRKPLHAQGDVIMAISKVLDRQDSATIAGEMGSGKTFMSMVIPYIHSKGKNFRCLIICPGHITRKWKREIESTIPDSRAVILRKLRDVVSLDTNRKPCCNEFYILSKDKGKLSYSWRPAVIENRRDAGFLCPDCSSPVLDDDSNPVSIASLNKKKMSCKNCESSLWTADNEGIRRFALGEYIKKYRAGYFDYLIADEVHQYKGGSTAQGNMFGSLASACKKTISLTGTLAGGYADELHFLIGRMSPERLIKDGIRINNVSGFAQRYGVFERVKKVYRDEDNSCSRGKKGKTILKRKPGISPLVYSKFLMDNTAFLHLEDLAIDLPPYNENVAGVEMGLELKRAYSKLECEIMEEARKAISTGSTRLLGILVINLLSYPDRPFNNPVIVDPRNKKKVISIPLSLPENMVYPKEAELVKLVRQAKGRGRKAWVFCEYTDKRDVTERLKNILINEKINAEILKSSVTPELRESWIEKQVCNGTDVIISGARLVETGIDLLAFPEIVFYEQPLSFCGMK